MNGLLESSKSISENELQNPKIWKITMECSDGAEIIIQDGAIMDVDFKIPVMDKKPPWEETSLYDTICDKRPTVTLKLDMSGVVYDEKL